MLQRQIGWTQIFNGSGKSSLRRAVAELFLSLTDVPDVLNGDQFRLKPLTLNLLGAMRIKLTNMLSIFADSLGQASNFQSIVSNGGSPAANLIVPACLGKCLVSKFK